ncbi:MAG TPA: FAD-dependent oxidoreductase, partial [Gemmataceae bacterium]
FDRELATSSRLFRFVLRMFAEGDAALPEGGMGAIPAQLAARLPDGSVRLGARVRRVGKGGVTLEGGEEVRARAVVVATEGPEAARLFRGVGPDDFGRDVPDPGSRGTTTLYYAAPVPPVGEPVLVLDADRSGPANHLAVVSAAAPSYAPAGSSLIALSVIGAPGEGDEALDAQARRQMGGWFGAAVAQWRLLRVYRIPHALPDQRAGALSPPRRPVRVHPGLYVCGDHRDNASIDGAMTSGFRAAQAVMEDMHHRVI